MNQSVHSCIRGCFTLKFSGSWKTVIGPSAGLGTCEFPVAWDVVFSSALPGESFSFVGEMGIVSSGTGDFGSTMVERASRDAIAKAMN